MRWWVAAGLLLVLVAVLAWIVWSDPAGPPPRTREYRDVTACLLTDERGISGAQAAPVWAGMQEASLATLAKVQFLEVDGAQTPENAQTYLASLVQSRCDLVLAVGDAQLAALAATAPKYPNMRFVSVGGTASGPNVSVVEETTPKQVQNKVNELVRSAVGPAPGR
jgi:basic membrane lipoprotein Med (substrate-binding protein (PBP1-ABC) superfamily)